MKDKKELKKQLIILSIVLILVIGVAIALNMINRENESYTKIKDSTSNETTQNTSVDDFMDRLKGLIDENSINTENNSINERDNVVTYDNTDIIQTEAGEIVLYREENQEQ